MILQNLILTVIKTTGTNEGKVFYLMRPMVLRCMILSVVLRLGSGASDFDNGQVMIVYCKCVWLTHLRIINLCALIFLNKRL